MPRTVIDIHVLQTVPPSNLNRDDTGSPKTAYYGGVRRARVSSQAWKRATRTAFSEGSVDSQELGVRTKRLVEIVVERLKSVAPEMTELEAAAAASQTLTLAGFKLEKPRPKKDVPKDEPAELEQSGYLFFLSARQVEKLADFAILVHSGEKPTKKDIRTAFNAAQSIDIALFGRMVADAPEINVDAAAQVAHAISVHAVDNEFDYFTAVDDLSPEDNAGAGMIGTVEFNSSTLYRYATVDVDNLRRNLAGAGDADAATARAVQAFVRAFVTSMPTGKQNTFANRTLPDAVVVLLRESQPVNLVGAFEEAVVADSERAGRLRVAAERLADYAQSTDAAFGGAPLSGWVIDRGGEATAPLRQLGVAASLERLVDALGAALLARVSVPA